MHHITTLFFSLLLMFISVLHSQSLPSIELNPDWTAKIELMVQGQENISVKKQKKVLIFSLHTGYNHWVIPHAEAVMKTIAQNTADFEVIVSKDIAVFEKKQLSSFDVVILNNNCSARDRRDLFWDVLNGNASLSEKEKIKKSQQLERNLIQFVKKGKGLMILHGGIVMQNNSMAFSDLSGGSFDFHPPQQEIHVKLVDPDHPMVASFDPEGFVHYDEPYFFNNAYFRYDFRPLLYMDLDKIKMKRERPSDKIKYISWIKRFGKGRVFYSSPSHNAQSYENPKLLQFLTNGLLYTADLMPCDDSPIGYNP
jgi:uncharacterized protein